MQMQDDIARGGGHVVPTEHWDPVTGWDGYGILITIERRSQRDSRRRYRRKYRSDFLVI